MTTTPHPGAAVVTLYSDYADHCAQARQKRRQASELRKAAKACPLKVDAYGMRQAAKPLSDQARVHREKSNELFVEMLEKSKQAHQLLTARMPAGWGEWGFVKTRAYANLLQILTAQVSREHPKPIVLAAALGGLLTHETWDEKTLQKLGVATDAKSLISA